MIMVIALLLVISCSYQQLITEKNESNYDKCYKIIRETIIDANFKEVIYVDTCKN